jgi:transposase
MDMNAQYDSAFREHCPWIAVIYDAFHLVKLYNDRVLTAMRRRKQNELAEDGDQKGYQLYKGSRYIVLSDRKTLQEKDRKERENNRMLDAMSLRGTRWLAGSRKMSASNERRLDELLGVNDDLNKAYFLLDQLKAAFQETDPKSLFRGLRQ